MDTSIESKKSSVLGGILLIAGCGIGAGMLGLPVVSVIPGFIPASVTMLLSCLFMMCTGLILLEATLWFQKEVNLISIAGFALGKFGELLTWILFLFVFYCLMVAYIGGGGELLAGFINAFSPIAISDSVGGLICTLVIGILIYLGAKSVDLLNRLFMIGLAASYCALVATGAPHINTERLLQFQWTATLSIIPIMIISFGYHNMIPSLTYYLKRNVQKLRFAIIVGNLIPLVIYMLWQAIVLGILPAVDDKHFQEILGQSDMVTGLLKSVSGSPSVVVFINSFAFFAIITSFITNGLSFVDFLADGFKISKTSVNKMMLCCLILIPPMLLAFSYPHLFLEALGIAGGFAAVILFGILPATVVWIGRYRLNIMGEMVVPGGKPLLVGVILISLVILAIEISKQLSEF